MTTLKELIQQKQKEIEQASEDQKGQLKEEFLNTEVTIKHRTTVQKSLRKVLPENWDKIEFTDVWEPTLTEKILRSRKLLKENGEFASKRVLDKFKKFVDNSKKLIIYDPSDDRQKIKMIKDIFFDHGHQIKRNTVSQIARVFRESRKIAWRTNADDFQNQEAFEFLQSIIDNSKVSVAYLPRKKFQLKEWIKFKEERKDDLKINIDSLDFEIREETAQKWLDENYPKTEERKKTEKGDSENNDLYKSKRATSDKGPDFSYGWDNRGKTREEIKRLDISKQSLKGKLKLKRFNSLERLDCSNNQLAELDLSDCSNLTWIKCSNNEFDNLNSLIFVEKLKDLKCLYVNDCSNLKGSLKSLKNSNQLKKIDISNTEIKEELEDLPESCKKIYCSSSYPCQSTKIMEELDRSKCSVHEEGKYDLDQWRTEKQNNMIASVIPLEKLYVIRGNIKQFINKWGKEAKDDWFDKWLFVRRTKTGTDNKLNELSKLQSPNNPDELQKERWAIRGTQTFGRSAAIAGAVLLFNDLQAAGGGISAVYPVSELLVAKLEERLKNKEAKWKEFLNDSDAFSDNFNELLGIVRQFEAIVLREGRVSEALKGLKKEVKEFLDEYDKNDDKEINISELIEKRKELAKHLKEKKDSCINRREKGGLWGVVEKINNLEKAIIEYRRLSHYGAKEMNFEEKLSDITNISSVNINETNKQNQQHQEKLPDWTDLHPSFTSKVVEEWKKNGFTYEQCKEWMDFFKPDQQSQIITELEFYVWLREEKKLDIKWVCDYKDIQSLKSEFQESRQQIQGQNWKSISYNFTEKLVQDWKDLGFTFEQTQDWIDIGLNPQDYNFAIFLKTQKNLSAEEVLNHGNLESLKQEFAQSQQTPQIQVNSFNK